MSFKRYGTQFNLYHSQNIALIDLQGKGEDDTFYLIINFIMTDRHHEQSIKNKIYLY